MHIPRTGLARAISKMGYCSRSAAAQKISAGEVSVNGRIVHDPERAVQIPRDRIEIDGQLLYAVRKVYVMLDKPRGVVPTASHEKHQRTLYQLLPQSI